MNRHIEPILDPTGGTDAAADTTLAPRLATLEGATLALLNNGKANSANLLSEFGEQFTRAYGVRKAVMYQKGYFGTPVERTQIEEIVQSCDFAVAATGD